MSGTWKIRVETNDGQVKEFVALSCYELTENQKLIWKTWKDQEKITATRVKVVSETKERNGWIK